MDLKIFDLGKLDFEEAWRFQKETFQKVKCGEFDSAFIFCQHYPVITLGRASSKSNILKTEDALKDLGIKVIGIERGGDVTYHGLGQLMLYPVLNLNSFKKDLQLLLRNLEELTINLLAEFGVMGKRISGFTGVWVDNKKIASIGITVKNWISYHGLAINIKRDDLANFSLIRPCGMDIIMTSVEDVLGRQVEIEDIKKTLKRRLLNDQSCFT